VEYAHDIVLLAREGTVPQGFDKITEIGRFYGMKMNVEKTKSISILRQPSTGRIMVEQ
jgi:hypothetical protein